MSEKEVGGEDEEDDYDDDEMEEEIEEEEEEAESVNFNYMETLKLGLPYVSAHSIFDDEDEMNFS